MSSQSSLRVDVYARKSSLLFQPRYKFFKSIRLLSCRLVKVMLGLTGCVQEDIIIKEGKTSNKESIIIKNLE